MSKKLPKSHGHFLKNNCLESRFQLSTNAELSCTNIPSGCTFRIWYSLNWSINSLIFGTRKYIIGFSEAHQRTLFWDSWLQSPFSRPIPLISILLLSSYLHQGHWHIVIHVGISTKYGSWQGQELFLVSKSSNPGLRPTQTPVQWIPSAFSSR